MGLPFVCLFNIPLPLCNSALLSSSAADQIQNRFLAATCRFLAATCHFLETRLFRPMTNQIAGFNLMSVRSPVVLHRPALAPEHTCSGELEASHNPRLAMCSVHPSPVRVCHVVRSRQKSIFWSHLLGPGCTAVYVPCRCRQACDILHLSAFSVVLQQEAAQPPETSHRDP